MDDPSLTLVANPSGPLRGTLRVPGDKSISHRALMLGAIAEGSTEVAGFLEGEDTLATLAAFRAMGVPIEQPGPQRLRIHGAGLHGLEPPQAPLYLGNSGTSMRLLAGLLAGQRFDSELTGDASLSRRPMRRILDPLRRMGARLACTAEGTAPIRIGGGSALVGIDYEMPIASAQVKSGLLLAGLYARGRTCIREPALTRDHTERLLERCGAALTRSDDWVCMQRTDRLLAQRIEVPGDLSSAAFFLVGAAIAPGSELLLEGVGVNPSRTGVLQILRRMGADITVLDEHLEGGEPVADLFVRASPLRGIPIPPQIVPLAIDEFPALFVAAACAEGETVLSGAEELRYKESDRIAVMAAGLQGLGIDARATADGMVIRGGSLVGGHIDSRGDHRIAMAMAMAALRATALVVIEDCANIDTSFPGFVEVARSVGLDLAESPGADALG